MNRRNFIKVAAATGVITSIPIGMSISNVMDKTYLDPWVVDKLPIDLRMRLIRCGSLAANPHNKQPWHIKLDNDEKVFYLFVDRDRLLPATDPFYRQIHIGQGTFLENVSIAASQQGYRANIELFPDGEYSNKTLRLLPVAKVTLGRVRPEKSGLYTVMFERVTNKSTYRKIQFPEKVEYQLKTISNEYGLNLKVFQRKKMVKNISKIAIEAMRIEGSRKSRTLETLAMFRVNGKERNKMRDGFGVGQMGMNPLLASVLETFVFSRKSYENNLQKFEDESMKIIVDQTNSASAYVLLSTNGNSRTDQVNLGRAYQRINLVIHKEGLAMHPLSQVLQEYSDMTLLHKEFRKVAQLKESETPQMLFRVGEGQKIEHSARRKTKDLLI